MVTNPLTCMNTQYKMDDVVREGDHGFEGDVRQATNNALFEKVNVRD